MEDFLDLFDHAAYQIQGNPAANANGGPRQANIIIGETESSRSSWSSRQRSVKIELLGCCSGAAVREGADFAVWPVRIKTENKRAQNAIEMCARQRQIRHNTLHCHFHAQYGQNSGLLLSSGDLRLKWHNKAIARWAGQHSEKHSQQWENFPMRKSLTRWMWWIILIGLHYAFLAPRAIKSKTPDHQVWFSALWRERGRSSFPTTGPRRSAGILLVAYVRHWGTFTAKREKE